MGSILLINSGAAFASKDNDSELNKAKISTEVIKENTLLGERFNDEDIKKNTVLEGKNKVDKNVKSKSGAVILKNAAVVVGSTLAALTRP